MTARSLFFAACASQGRGYEIASLPHHRAGAGFVSGSGIGEIPIRSSR
ncbi:hypothetical protein [Lysobacter gummosus]